ncbi:DUF5629 family protein [Pseudomonas sp. UBA6562]|uniref:DUF5629 family protein n=1 Tax=Pseudomonas sp. UBA6562 TaxID=1947332 RepID=UPI0025F340E6|nr:DUF5629 family protein [Pseudomonas sp. UBA6562]
MTLLAALESCDMLLIDDLHCFDFHLDDDGLMAECMDGRQLRRWQFNPQQVAAAQREGDQWRIDGVQGQHRLVCMSALRATDEDDDEEDPQAPAHG